MAPGFSLVPSRVREQYTDNLQWIESASANRLVVGSQARILYAEVEGRVRIALAFNEAIARRQIFVHLLYSN